ncbi:FGGY family carbohydrate kinase [Leifsonia sp. fls2-241-R2A-40a]|uniref:FGGY family carbohydrate kinase n=1 Tax=Leifsonia sp. fls2-241-R2A-40a TaxID=3040290 RepID=UPI00254C459B|nr:FGGY family carbohydrate kinase [Leifsonia sp. fls2-241-R2A-40a]
MEHVTPASLAALGVDVGTTNTKVVLAVLGDGVREERTVTVPTPGNGAGLQAVVLAALRDVAADSPLPVAAIGIAAMGETGCLTAPDGRPLGNLLRWADGDGASADRLVAAAGAEALYAATGVPVPSKSPLSHWLRLSDDGDARLADANWLGADGLVISALTGQAATDHTLAARTMAYRLPAAGAGDALSPAFDADLLALAGLTPDRFPRVARPGETAGRLTAAAAAATGLAAGLPVIAAGHDHAVGAWAAGVRAPGDAADSVGTAEALLRVTADVPREGALRHGMSLGRTVDGRHETLLAGNPAAGALVEWTFAELLPGTDRNDVLAQALACADGPVEAFLLPYLRGRQSPAPDASATPRLVDLTGGSAAASTRLADPASTLTAVLAGLALQLAWMDAAQTELAGPRRERLAVLGGPGAGNDAWWRLKQRILPGSLGRVDAAEPVATGAAMLAAHRVAGLTTSLPLRSADSAASAGDPALLDAFVQAATLHDKETV